MVDWGAALTGGLTGGAAFGPWGAAGGALLGGFGGKKGKKDKVQNYNYNTPAQQGYQDYVLSQLQEPTQSGFDWVNSILSDEEGAFDDYEAPFIEQFNEEFVPQIIERIMGRGSGSKGSGSLNRALAQGARGLSRDLAAQRANLKASALDRLNQFSQTGMARNQGPYVQQGRESAFDTVAPYAGRALIDRYGYRGR